VPAIPIWLIFRSLKRCRGKTIYRLIAPTWRFQDLVETSPTGLVSHFELLGAEPSEVTVTAALIVESIDVVGYISLRQLAILVDLFLDSAVRVCPNLTNQRFSFEIS
jgi:hypothetical protein